MTLRALPILAVTLTALVALFLLWGLRAPVGFILELRVVKLAALVLVGASCGISTVLFQTVAGNRLVTPGIVEFDALFIFIQTMLVFSLGGIGFAALPVIAKFGIETCLLAGIAVTLFGVMLRNGAEDLVRTILTGVILGILLRGLASFAQRLLDPSEFAIVQQASFASFGAIDRSVLVLSAAVTLPAILLAWRLSRPLNLAGLGRDKARSLGLDYDRLLLATLVLISVMVAAATALVGPVGFLGLIAASLARAATGSEDHRRLIPAAALVGAAVLVAGQALFERFLGLQSSLAVIVEFGGGLLFLYLVFRESRR